MVTVGQLMTKEVVAVETGTPVVETAKVMASRKIGSVLVQENGEIVGIVTESDIVRKVVGAGLGPYFVPVEHVMSAPVIGIDQRRPITDAADLMERHGTRHLAVEQAGTIVGVLSVRDLLHPVSVDEF